MADPNNPKNSKLLIIGAGIVFIVIIAFQWFSLQSNDPYLDRIIATRKQHNAQLKNSPESPLKEAERAGFTTLKYFAPDKAYIIMARFIPNLKRDTIRLMTTTGVIRKMINTGKLHFKFQKKEHTLLGFKYIEDDAEKDMLFIPFKDLTSGAETYGGGRYLEVKRTPGQETVMLDFNAAYNPYCVYNDAYSCPVPPRENFIEAEIRAGEMDYK